MYIPRLDVTECTSVLLRELRAALLKCPEIHFERHGVWYLRELGKEKNMTRKSSQAEEQTGHMWYIQRNAVRNACNALNPFSHGIWGCPKLRGPSSSFLLQGVRQKMSNSYKLVPKIKSDLLLLTEHAHSPCHWIELTGQQLGV